MILDTRQLWGTAPPEPRSRDQNWPTLLYSWWCTAFAATIIIVRLNGRKVRSGRLFREDWIMIWALLPLFLRMILVHFILIYGTNNINTVGYTFTDEQLYHHSIGARLVLASRIIYAAFIWMSKWTVSEFLKRMTISLWKDSYERTLQGIRGFLIFTFIAVVIATLAECQPFDHYWQVVPDPGPQCRQGFAQLLTMGIADIITDILLIAFPIPIVLRSGQPWTRKLLLTALFSTSVILIIVTGFRMPEVIAAQGRQQYRTVWASSEILASTFVSNFIIIGSFLRDKGTKRNKYRATSVTDSVERVSTRRPTIVAISHNDSDEDLFRSLGCRLPEHLQDPKIDNDPAAVAMLMSSPYSDSTVAAGHEAVEDDYDDSSDSLHKPPLRHDLPSPSPSFRSKRNMSIFDVGGLLEDGHDHSSETRSLSSTAVMSTSGSTTIAHDFAPPSPAGTRRGSRAFMVDLGSFLRSEEEGRRSNGTFTSLAGRYRHAPTGVLGPALERQDTEISLQDAGGLLSPNSRQDQLRDVGGLLSSRSRQDQLQDVGGLLSSRSRQDQLQDVGGLQREAPRTIHHQVQSRFVNSSSSTNPVSRPYESIELQDAGGLLR